MFDLKQRSDRIKRGARLDSLEFSPVLDGRFTVTARWVSSSKGKQEYTRVFTIDTAFNYAGTGRMVPKERPCSVATKLIKEIQRQQGRRRR